MLARRTLQSVLALALCIALAADLGGIYIAAAVATIIIAVMTGVYIFTAVGLGLVWPVLAVAYVLHVTRDIQLRAQTTSGPASRASERSTAKTDGPRVEDP